MMIKAKSVITDMVMFMNRFILLDVFANKQKMMKSPNVYSNEINRI